MPGRSTQSVRSEARGFLRDRGAFSAEQLLILSRETHFKDNTQKQGDGMSATLFRGIIRFRIQLGKDDVYI